MNPNDYVTPGGAIALVVAGVMAWLRFREDRPKIHQLELDKVDTDRRYQELREANAGLTAMVRERMDFGGAVTTMADMTRAVREGNVRFDTYADAASTEHREMTGVLRELMRWLEVHNGAEGWDMKSERRKR